MIESCAEIMTLKETRVRSGKKNLKGGAGGAMAQLSKLKATTEDWRGVVLSE